MKRANSLNPIDKPNWQRAEVELRNIDRVIPLDVLINPDPIFAGAYRTSLADLLEAVVPVSVKTNKTIWSEFSQAFLEKD